MPLAPQISASGKLFLLVSIFCPASWEQSAMSPIYFNGTGLFLAGLVVSQAFWLAQSLTLRRSPWTLPLATEIHLLLCYLPGSHNMSPLHVLVFT